MATKRRRAPRARRQAPTAETGAVRGDLQVALAEARAAFDARFGSLNAQPEGARREQAVDAVIHSSLSLQTERLLASIPRSEREYLRVHFRLRFPEPVGPGEPPLLVPFHAEITTTSRAAAESLARISDSLRLTYRAAEEKPDASRIDLQNRDPLIFEPVVGGFLEATRALFRFEEVEGALVTYRRGARP